MRDGGNSSTSPTTQPFDNAPAWSPDGRQIAFESDRGGGLDIYVMNADGSAVKRLTNDPATDSEPAWSLDGKSIAFWSTRDGNAEIYVTNANGRHQVNLTRHSGDDSQLAGHLIEEDCSNEPDDRGEDLADPVADDGRCSAIVGRLLGVDDHQSRCSL